MSADQAIAALNKAYRIRTDAMDPITVSYAKADRQQSGDAPTRQSGTSLESYTSGGIGRRKDKKSWSK